jgi:hypothetical protein
MADSPLGFPLVTVGPSQSAAARFQSSRVGRRRMPQLFSMNDHGSSATMPVSAPWSLNNTLALLPLRAAAPTTPPNEV